MKETIYKYALAIEGMQNLHLPAEAKILSVQNQNGILCLWALVNPSCASSCRVIEILDTGHPVDLQPRTFIGTVQIEGLVWHVFEQH